jgi:hypothetical protein
LRLISKIILIKIKDNTKKSMMMLRITILRIVSLYPEDNLTSILMIISQNINESTEDNANSDMKDNMEDDMMVNTIDDTIYDKKDNKKNNMKDNTDDDMKNSANYTE